MSEEAVDVQPEQDDVVDGGTPDAKPDGGGAQGGDKKQDASGKSFATAGQDPADDQGGAGDQDGEGGDEGKGEGDGGSDEGAPDSYAQFTLPEGIALEGERLEAAVSLFKDMNLSQETAQKLVSWYSEQELKRVAAEQAEAQAEKERKTEEKIKSIKEDPVVGGKNLDNSRAAVGRALYAFDPDESFSAWLDSSGVGNDPEMFRFLTAVGQALQEDSGGGKGGGPGNSPLAGLYPTMFQD